MTLRYSLAAVCVLSLLAALPAVAQTGHTDYVGTIAFSPDGKRLASGSGDNTIKLWDPATGRLLRTLGGNVSPAASASASLHN